MDLVFRCPKCDQELEVDSSGVGQEIECPSCHSNIVIPGVEGQPQPSAEAPADSLAAHNQAGAMNAIASSAAAKVVMHLKVPVHDKPTEQLVTHANKPLEVAAKESDRKMRVKTIRHIDCVEVGHDKFDETVSNFLMKVGEPNVVSITGLSYSIVDIVSQKLLTDYGVMVIYRG